MLPESESNKEDLSIFIIAGKGSRGGEGRRVTYLTKPLCSLNSKEDVAAYPDELGLAEESVPHAACLASP